MHTVSPEELARARKTQSLVLRAVAAVGQQAIADAIGKDTSTVSRMMAPDKFSDYVTAITVAGLKVVPADAHCYSAGKYVGLLVLALDSLAFPPIDEKFESDADRNKFAALRTLSIECLLSEIHGDTLGPKDRYQAVRTLAMEALAREVQREQPKTKAASLEWGGEE